MTDIAPEAIEATPEAIERPDHVAERFWDSESNTANYENMGNAYNELNSKFGGFTGAPKDGYEPIEGYEEGDEMLSAFTDWAKEGNMSQAMFNKGFEILSAQSNVSSEVSKENELAQLGDNPQARIDKVDNYLINNLSKEDYEEMSGLVTTAQGVKLIEALIPAQSQHKLSDNNTSESSGLTLAEVNEAAFKKDDNGNLLRSVDPAYDKKIIEMYGKVS